eukprot:COSAG01_NODE_7337_length_3244_cov_3.393005_2_plen_227_part_00
MERRPAWFKQFTSLLGVLNLELQSLFAWLHLPNLDCAFNLNFAQKWYLIVMSPFIVLAISIIVLLFNALFRWITSRADVFNADRLMPQFIRINLFYLIVGNVILVGTALQPVVCVEDIEGEYVVLSQPSMKCDWCASVEPENSGFMSGSGSWELSLLPDESAAETGFGYWVTRHNYRDMATVAIVASILYGVGTPFFVLTILLANRKRLKSSAFVGTFGKLLSASS